MPAMTHDTTLPFSFPAVSRKQVRAAFDGGRLTSDGGVMLPAMAERRLGIADRLARIFPDRRDPSRIMHSFADMIRARIFAICCGYEDADDLDVLRTDPAFKLACGRLPQGCSTLSTERHGKYRFEAAEGGGEAILSDCVGLITPEDIVTETP